MRTHKSVAFPGPEAGTLQSKVRGEAVAVDLGQRGTLFALLRGPQGSNLGAQTWAWTLLPNRPEPTGALPANYEALKQVRGSTNVSYESTPIMVRFRDMNDPNSIELVGSEDLQVHFGGGVSLRRVRVEITDDRVTRGIEERVPWLPDLEGGYLPTTPRARPLTTACTAATSAWVISNRRSALPRQTSVMGLAPALMAQKPARGVSQGPFDRA